MSNTISNLQNAVTQITQNTYGKNITEDFGALFEDALASFYEIHQQSQISGVSSSKYNNALSALGLDPEDTQSAFQAIQMLEEKGYNTGIPSDEAILKYGAINQEYGNKSYMRDGTTNDTLSEEIKLLNEITDDFYDGAENYFDMAERRSNATKADKEQLFEMLNQPSSIETTNGTEDVSSFELENVIKQHILSIFEEEKESILTNLFNKIE